MYNEKKIFKDPVSGVDVTQYTDYKGHSHHLYFTNPGWYDDGRRLLIASDRNNKSNLFGLDIASGDIEQLTDLDEANRSFLPTCVNPIRSEAYFRDRDSYYAIDLKTRQTREVFHIGADWNLHMSNCAADGEHVYLSIFHDPEGLIKRFGSAASPKMWESRPLSRIVQIPCGGGEPKIIHEEKRWLAHVNTSPTRPELLTFCYEGPWHKVGQRIWVMNVLTGDIKPVRPVSGEEIVGHEYWYADGVRIGYHGQKRPGLCMLGHIRYDNTEQSDTAFPTGGNTGHIFSLDDQLIVGDGDGLIKCWRLENGSYSAPRILCSHNSAMKIQKTHPHPRISPDRKYVIFTSDRGGYGNVYMVPLVPFDQLEEFVQE